MSYQLAQHNISVWDYTSFDGLVYVTLHNQVFATISNLRPQGKDLLDVINWPELKLWIASSIPDIDYNRPFKWHGIDFKI